MIIKYNIYESVLGVDYVTPCPFGQKGRYTHELINVGSNACCRCQYHTDKNTECVKCKYDKKDVTILPKEEKIFINKKEWRH